MAKYSCRHGLSYVKYLCDYSDIHTEQTLFVAMDDPVELWNLTLCNDSGRPRRLSVYSYCEFSFHQIDMDNRNFQMSLYAAGSSYADGIIEHELHYEENGFQFFAADFEPDGFDCLRDDFIGAYRTERDPQSVVSGECRGRFENGGNHCGVLKKRLTLAPDEDARLIFMLGEGGRETGRAMREKYTAARERGIKAMDSVDEYLYTDFGLMLNAPCYTKPDDGIGFVTRVYPGLKENGAIFSHPNPWAWCAEAVLGRGSRAMKFYNALCPALQNDKIRNTPVGTLFLLPVRRRQEPHGLRPRAAPVHDRLRGLGVLRRDAVHPRRKAGFRLPARRSLRPRRLEEVFRDAQMARRRV